ncbi:MAG: 2-C-methyl-D-erythritol 4-phosphate cytidylyltransferase [Betaproteobacteria bacterium]
MSDLAQAPTFLPAARFFVLIPSAGVGARALQPGAPALPKQYQVLCGQPLLLHTVQAFEALGDLLGGIAVVVAAQDEYIDALVQGRALQLLRCGGASRADSVRQGLQLWQQQAGGPGPADWVLVHDAARCLIEPEQVRHLIERCRDDPVGGLLALPLPDTLKSEQAGRVAQTLERAGKWLAQTPQMFRLGALEQALRLAQAQGLPVTDEASAMEAQGLAPLLVAGSAQNFKVTYPQDFSLAQAVLESRSSRQQVHTA